MWGHLLGDISLGPPPWVPMCPKRDNPREVPRVSPRPPAPPKGHVHGGDTEVPVAASPPRHSVTMPPPHGPRRGHPQEQEPSVPVWGHPRGGSPTPNVPTVPSGVPTSATNVLAPARVPVVSPRRPRSQEVADFPFPRHRWRRGPPPHFGVPPLRVPKCPLAPTCALGNVPKRAVAPLALPCHLPGHVPTSRGGQGQDFVPPLHPRTPPRTPLAPHLPH